MVAHNPLHGSGRAAFPHPALASGDDAKSPQGIGVADARGRQPAVDEPPHPVPENPAVLATPRESALPEPTHLEPEDAQRRTVHGHSVVADVSPDDRAQPCAHRRDGVMQASPELGFDLAQLRLQSFANRLPQHREASVAPLLPADVRSGRTMARTGLRMMPTFPSSPLRFRTAGFPQYGSKVGISDVAFPHPTLVKPAPGLPFAMCGSHSSFVLSAATVWSAFCAAARRPVEHRRSGEFLALPQGPSLRTGLCCPGPSSLNRPHPPHSRAQRDFAALRFIRAAFAVRERLGDPRVVPRFRCSFLLGMPSSTTPGSPPAACTQLLDRQRWPSQSFKLFGTPSSPTIRSTWDFHFGATSVRSRYGLSSCSPLWRIRPEFPPADGDVYTRAFDESVTLLAAGYDYGGSWAASTGGSHTRWNDSQRRCTEAEEVERLGLPLTEALPVLGCIRAELQEARLLGMQLQPELPDPLGKFRPEPLGIRLDLKSKHAVVGEPDDDDIAAGSRPAPYLDPEVKRVVEVEVRQERRCAAALRRPLLHPYSLPVLQHACVQPFLDEPHDAPVRNPVLDELHQPSVVDGIEEATDVHVEHPVHLPRQQPRVERVQRVVLAAPRPEPVREAEEIGLVDGVQHLDRCALDNLVLQRRDPKRPLPPVGLGDVHPADRLRPVRPAFQPVGEVLEVLLQCLAVVPPRLAVHARSSFLLETEVGRPKRFGVVDVVQERREPRLPVPFCCLTYPLQRTGRACPARSPGRVLLSRVPFGQAPSLHPLRGHFSGVVRRLHRYCGPVRLPVSVHHRRMSLDFPTRPEAPSAWGGHGTSRLPRKVFPYVHGVSDRAGPWSTSRCRCTRWGLPLSPTASASRRESLSRLNTRPARTPVNASVPPLQAAPHDSGPVWVANPSPYDSFIHCTSPV